MGVRFVLLVVAGLILACAPSESSTIPIATSVASASPASAAPRVPTTPTPSTAVPAVAASPSSGPAPLPHVFVIVMENASLARALEQPYIAHLAAQYAIATNYRAVGSPSLPNYLALTSGSTWDIADDSYHALPAGGIGEQLDQAGIPWRAYMEGLTEKGCLQSPYPYALKHNPFAFYGGRCPSNVVPFDALAADLSGSTPTFAWITPDLCHDGHDCGLAAADRWLSQIVPQITTSAAWRAGGLVFITWDEPDGAGGSIPLIVIGPQLTARTSAAPYDHYSLLATVEDVLHLPRLAAARTATPLTELIAAGH